MAAALVSSPAVAAEGLFLTWNDCALSPSATSTASSSCDTESGSQHLYCAFRLAQPIDSVFAVEIVVDVQHVSSTLPAWWQFAPKGCRQGALIARADTVGGGACVDFWLGEATQGGPPPYFTMEPRGGANQARIKFAFALLPERARSLNAIDMYYAARLEFRNVGTRDCEGCSEPACLVLNSIMIGRHPAASGDVVLVTPGPADGNRAIWQSVGADCGAVPTRRRSWGQVKGLYR